MSQENLKWMRFITPAIIILLFWSIAGTVTDLWDPIWPETPEQWKASTLYVILALIYYLTPLRKLSNKLFFKDITENIRAKLVKISGTEDNKELYSWKSLRGIFYYLIDNDKSLSTKARLAYFNGWVWSTLADIRAISTILAIIFFFISLPSNINNALVLFFIFGFIALLTIPASNEITNQHRAIADEQIEIIEHYYLENLKEKLQEVKTRNGN